MQILTIYIKLEEASSEVNLNLRHTLVSTLEERGIGEVFDEGMGNDFMDVSPNWSKTIKQRNWRKCRTCAFLCFKGKP